MMVAKEADRILIVDDDALSRNVLNRVLSKAGFICSESAKGVDALEKIHAEPPPSLLLLDFAMPGLSGAEVLRHLRADPDPVIAQIPTIMLTAHTDEKSEVLCLEAGADDFVTKPINLAVLNARIETQLRLRSMRQQLQQQNNELETWRSKLEEDLAAARLTQQALIPQETPALPGWEIATCYRPVIQVGGDIYGWMQLSGSQTLFWIADATGHGATGALITALSKLLFHHSGGEYDRPSEIMAAVNDDFRSIFGTRSFMTAMCVALEPHTGRASVAGAGHPPLLVSRHADKTEALFSSAPPIGLIDQSSFAETEFNLNPGDAFLLYTDGLYGAEDNGAGRLTINNVLEMIPSNAESAQALLDMTLMKIAPNQTEQPDDLAVLVVRRGK